MSKSAETSEKQRTDLANPSSSCSSFGKRPDTREFHLAGYKSGGSGTQSSPKEGNRFEVKVRVFLREFSRDPANLTRQDIDELLVFNGVPGNCSGSILPPESGEWIEITLAGDCNRFNNPQLGFYVDDLRYPEKVSDTDISLYVYEELINDATKIKKVNPIEKESPLANQKFIELNHRSAYPRPYIVFKAANGSVGAIDVSAVLKCYQDRGRGYCGKK